MLRCLAAFPVLSSRLYLSPDLVPGGGVLAQVDLILQALDLVVRGVGHWVLHDLGRCRVRGPVPGGFGQSGADLRPQDIVDPLMSCTLVRGALGDSHRVTPDGAP